MCIKHTSHPAPAQTEAIEGSPNAVTSLIIQAPNFTHAEATTDFDLSTEPRTLSAQSPATPGKTLTSSSSKDTPLDPGRVDSPPTSTTSAPSETIFKPAAIASSEPT